MSCMGYIIAKSSANKWGLCPTNVGTPKSQGSQGAQGMLCWRSSGTNLKSTKMVQKLSNFTNFIQFFYVYPARFMAYQP